MKKKSKLKKKVVSHLKEDMDYYKSESKQDKKNIDSVKKAKKVPVKKLIKHLKGDMKGFKGEIKGDKKLIKEIKTKKKKK